MDSISNDFEELTDSSQGNHQPLIKPIKKDVIHRICSGQVRKCLPLREVV